MRLQVFSKRIIVMLANPKGKTTREQLIEARKLAYLSILQFAKERNLALGQDFEKKLGTHHVLELEQANKAFQTVCGPYAEQIEARTGSLVLGDSSHPGKMEHQGGGTSTIPGTAAAENFEWLLWHFRREWSGTAGYMHEYNENLRLHLEVMKGILKATEELRDAIRKGGANVNNQKNDA